MSKNIVGFKVKKNNSQKGKNMLELIANDFESLACLFIICAVGLGIVSNWANENK